MKTGKKKEDKLLLVPKGVTAHVAAVTKEDTESHYLTRCDVGKSEHKVPLPMFLNGTELNMEITTQHFQTCVKGDLNWCTKMSGKSGSASSWCTYAKLSHQCLEVGHQTRARWTHQKILDAKEVFDDRTAKSKLNECGAHEEPLLPDFEPHFYIVPVLHVEMGLVDKALGHF